MSIMVLSDQEYNDLFATLLNQELYSSGKILNLCLLTPKERSDLEKYAEENNKNFTELLTDEVFWWVNQIRLINQMVFELKYSLSRLDKKEDKRETTLNVIRLDHTKGKMLSDKALLETLNLIQYNTEYWGYSYLPEKMMDEIQRLINKLASRAYR